MSFNPILKKEDAVSDTTPLCASFGFFRLSAGLTHVFSLVKAWPGRLFVLGIQFGVCLFDGGILAGGRGIGNLNNNKKKENFDLGFVFRVFFIVWGCPFRAALLNCG